MPWGIGSKKKKGKTDDTGYTDEQKAEMDKRKKKSKALSPIDARRKAMREILGN